MAIREAANMNHFQPSPAESLHGGPESVDEDGISAGSSPDPTTPHASTHLAPMNVVVEALTPLTEEALLSSTDTTTTLHVGPRDDAYFERRAAAAAILGDSDDDDDPDAEAATHDVAVTGDRPSLSGDDGVPRTFV